MSSDVQDIINKIKPILIKHGVVKADLFGSFVRGDSKPGSDVDVLVKMPSTASLFDTARLYGEMKDVLHKEVDIVSYGAINPRLKDSILRSTLNIL